MSEPDLLIRRVVARGRVPAGSAARSAVRRALGDGLGLPLEQALAATGHEGYWLIRKVEVSVCVGADWTTSRMAEVVARAVGDAVGHKARRGGDAAEALWFPDRATFWAQYLLDLARGQVHGRWEYVGLHPGPSWSEGAAALARDDTVGLAAALQRLRPAELDELVGRVRADPLVELLAHGAGSTAPVISAVRLLREQGRLAVGGSTGLLLAVTAASEGDRSGDPGELLTSVARPALDAAALVRRASTAGVEGARLLEAVAQGRWSEVARASGGDDFLGLVPWPVQERTALVDALAARPVRPPRDRLHTRFGGAFVLLPLLEDLWSWEAATAAWSEVEGVGAARLARLVVLAAAMGAARFDAALEDAALRTVLDIPGALEVRGWLAGQDPAPFVQVAGLVPGEAVDPWLHSTPAFLGQAAAVVLRELGRSLPGMAAASAAYLWHNVLDLEAWVTAEVGEDTGLIELGHAPLGVLLSLTGLGRGELSVEGAGVRRWTLTSRS